MAYVVIPSEAIREKYVTKEVEKFILPIFSGCKTREIYGNVISGNKMLESVLMTFNIAFILTFGSFCIYSPSLIIVFF
jgi:hypothetical protein